MSRGPSATRPAVVKQQQPIDHVEKREAVGRNNYRHPLVANGLQSVQKFGLAANIEMGCGLVEEQHPGLSDQNAGKPDRLFLASGQAAAALGDRHIVAHRMTGDEAFHA